MVWNKWRERIGQMALNQRVNKLQRTKSVIGLDQARTVGVIYNATDRNSYQTVIKFLKYLKEERKQVYSLGFINSKDPNQMLNDQLNDKYFNLKNLNWLSMPNCSKSDEFLNRDMDLLIDLSIHNEFPIDCLSKLSKAKYKVGQGKANVNSHVDLIIDIESNKTVEFLIVQLKHYLKIINPTKHAEQV